MRSILLHGSPVRNGKLYDPLNIRVLSAPGVEDLYDGIKETITQQDPYLWVLEVGKDPQDGTPICLLADHNIWEAEEQEQRRLRQFLVNSNVVSGLMGVALGVLIGVFLGRRA